MGKKIAVICSICIWIVLSVLSCCFVAQKSVHEMKNVYTANYKDGYLYGIEIDENQYYIFSVNVETGEQQYFTYPIKDEFGTVSLMDLVRDHNGNFYVHYETLKNNSSDSSISNISYCDFDKKRLVPVWDLKEISDQRYFMFHSLNDGSLIYETFDETNAILNQFYLNEDGTSSIRANIQISKDVYSLQSVENGVWAYSNMGDITWVGMDGSEKTVFLNDGSKMSRQNTNYSFDEDSFHFYNVDTGLNYKITKETDYEQIELCSKHQSVEAESFNIKDVHGISEADGVYAGQLDTEDGRSIAVVYGEKEFVLDRLTWSMGKTILVSLLMIVGVTFVLLLYIYIFKRMFRRKDGAPVLGIAIIVMIPIIALSMIRLFYVINQQFPDEREQKIQQLTVQNSILMEKIDIQQLETIRNKEENGYEEAAYYYYKLNELNVIKNTNTGQTELMNNASGTYLYHYKNGDLYPLSLSYQFNLSMKYQLPSKKYLALKEAAETGKNVYTEYTNYDGSFITVFSPIKNENDEVIGVLENSENVLLLEMSIFFNNQTIKKLFFGAGTLLFLMIIFVFWINTRALKTLRQAMRQTAAGDLKARAHIQGNHEVAVIARRFDHMADLIENRVSEMEAYQNKYEAFVPSKRFYLLRKNGIRAVLAGDCRDFTATIMTINIVYDKADNQHLYEYDFSDYNLYLQKQIPIIHTYGGVVNKIFRYGENAIFMKDTQQNVVECAIAVLDQMKGKRETFFIGIAEEELRFGVIGLPKRMVTEMISEHGSLSLFLQNMAAKFDTPILITGRGASRIPNFDTYYHTRIIGYLYMTSSNKLEVIYEVLNGENQERQRMKMDTKSAFEDGVRLFMAKSYAYARRRFIHVLQQDPKDGAAKEYVMLCEEYLHNQKNETCLGKF